jgi:hypothetical protein
MELIAGFWWSPAQVQTFAEPGERSSSRLVESLSFPNHRLEAIGQEGTHGPPFFSRKYPSFAEQVGVEFKGDVGFHWYSQHVKHVQRYSTCIVSFRQFCLSSQSIPGFATQQALTCGLTHSAQYLSIRF